MFFLLLIFTLFHSSMLCAWETDQYTLPSEELADIGPNLSRFILKSLEEVKTEYNSEKNSEDDLLVKNTIYDFRIKIANKVWAKIAPAISTQEHRDAIWGKNLDLFGNNNGKINDKPILYYAGKIGTIYSFSGFHRLLSSSYFIFSSTINTYGVEYGLDKVGHTFNEGHTYYQLYIKSLQESLNEKKAISNAIAYGVKSERTYYGKIVSGVYSNGDLAANLNGLLFYKNLFEKTTFNGHSYEAIYELNDQGELKIKNIAALRNIYQRLVTIHLNEAFNPSQYELFQRPIIKKAVRNRCKSWARRYPNWDENTYNLIFQNIKLLNGYEYGHRDHNLITIGDTCFR